MPTSHELAEKLAGLASRVNDLAVDTTGTNSRKLLELQDRLTDLALTAIVVALDEETAKYKGAITALNAAMAQIDEEIDSVERVVKTIQLVKRAADLAEALVKAAA
jgi:hypothetical protein